MGPLLTLSRIGLFISERVGLGDQILKNWDSPLRLKCGSNGGNCLLASHVSLSNTTKSRVASDLLAITQSVAGLVTKGSYTSETPEPTQTPSGQHKSTANVLTGFSA